LILLLDEKLTRRDFVKLLLAFLGAFFLFLLEKLISAPSVELSSDPAAVFTSWGQSNLKFVSLNVPYQELK
jgi:hypothetical protein